MVAEILEKIKNEQIKTAEFHNINLTVETAQTIYSSLKNSNINSLSFNRTPITKEVAPFIASLILENIKINTLDFSESELDDQTCNIFNTVVKYSPIISYNISQNRITNKSLNFLCSILGSSNNNTLVDLNLSKNPNLHLSEELNQELMDIDTESEKVDGLSSLCHMLKENLCIEKIDLSSLNLKDKEIEKIFRFLKFNHKIREINLENNQIGRKGFLSIKKLLYESSLSGSLPSSSLSFPPPCCLLKRIGLGSNDLSKSEICEIEHLLSVHRNLSDQREKHRTKIETVLVDSLETTKKLSADLQNLKVKHLKLTLFYLINSDSDSDTDQDKKKKKGKKSNNSIEDEDIKLELLFQDPQRAIELLYFYEQQNSRIQSQLHSLEEEVAKLTCENHKIHLKIRELRG